MIILNRTGCEYEKSFFKGNEIYIPSPLILLTPSANMSGAYLSALPYSAELDKIYGCVARSSKN